MFHVEHTDISLYYGAPVGVYAVSEGPFIKSAEATLIALYL